MMFPVAKAVVAATSILSFISQVTAQASLQQATYQGCYSTSSPMYTNSSLSPYVYQTSGWCQQQCGGYAEKPAFALGKGSDCYCGDKFPPESTKVDDSECNRPCQGYGQEMCGGMTTFSVYNSGLTTSVESASDDEASSAASSAGSSAAITKSTSRPTATQVQTTITQAGGQTTVIVTAGSAASTSTSDVSKSNSGGGASKAGIAAGVVVGILGIAAIAVGVFFFMRHKKRRAIEEEHERQQNINSFGRSPGTAKSEHSSDNRMDPTMMFRRQSDGSIADESDLSRRVLKVTNPDRNTMIA